MTKEQRYQKMKDAGIQPGSPAAKRFMRENETDEELKASGQRVGPTLLNESIKQTRHLKGIQDILTFFLILALISVIISIITAL